MEQQETQLDPDTQDFKPSTWTVSSNEALKISLVKPDPEAGAFQFSPELMYPIFGTDEKIYGYKDLVIHLAFDSITFKPFLNVKFSDKLDIGKVIDGDDIEVPDIISRMLEFLPIDDCIVSDEMKWVDSFTKERAQFELPEENLKIGEYDYNDQRYAIYRLRLYSPEDSSESPKWINFLKRIQIFTLLYIEAASYIKLETEPNWELYLLFNTVDKTCIGFTTVYKYFHYTGADKFDKDPEVHYRARISQFLILPPYQHCNHGRSLYNAIAEYWMGDNTIDEFTVEDPNELFDDMRDKGDLERLYRSGFFDSFPKVKDPTKGQFLLTDEWMSLNQHKFKLEKRQFGRLVEMILLYKNDMANFEEQVKRRIYRQNYETLCDITDPEEKKNAINTPYMLVTEDYRRIVQEFRSKQRGVGRGEQQQGE